MSDLYLVLRRRLDSVPEWVYLPTSDLKAARDRAGLSYEGLARQLPVSSKTWERYEKAGRVPRHLVPKVARILGLEIETPEVRPLTGRRDERLRAPAAGELVERLEALEAGQARTEEAL